MKKLEVSNGLRIIRSQRRTLSIEVVSESEVKIRAPWYCSDRRVRAFIEEKSDWVAKKQQQLSEEEKINHSIVDQGSFSYLGRLYRIEHRAVKAIGLEGDCLCLPEGWSDARCHTRLVAWFKERALDILLDRVECYSQKMQLFPSEVLLSNAKRRWGSCSSERVLRFNWRLLSCPMSVIDYLVVHELAHIQEMNHSQRFWELVQHFDPFYKDAEAWLKTHRNVLDSFR
ncbi:MAG: SprT family zinc-dependent metalloprotease [bacterium]